MGDNPRFHFIRRRVSLQVFAAIAGTLILGAFGSGLWELLFRPGLSKLGRLILTIITFGSGRIRDAAYQSAALDPRPVADLITLLTLSVLPFCVLAFIAGLKRGARDRNYLEQLTGEDREVALKRFKKKDLRYSLLAVLGLLWIGLTLGVVGLVNNQSVLIWRSFYANLDILAPKIGEQEIRVLNSRFRSIHSRADYNALEKDLQRLAATYRVQLHEVSLW